MNDDRIFPIKQELPTNFNLSLGNYEAQNKALTIDRMSTNIILIMEELAKNEEIFRLLSFLENPFGRDLDTTKIKEDDLIKYAIELGHEVVNSKLSRIDCRDI